MSLSSDAKNTGIPGVIKFNSKPLKVSIADFKTIIEEVEADLTDHAARSQSSLSLDETSTEAPHDIEQDDATRARLALDDAYEKGFENGKTESAKVLQSELEKKLNEMGGSFGLLVTEFGREVEQYKVDLEKDVIALATAIAKRVVAREIAVDESAVLSHAQEAIRKIIGVDKIKIHVNPSDEEYIREHRNGLSNYADSVKEIAIEPDSKVERGGCIIESELGNVDARISTQLQLIEESLLNLVKR